MNILGLSAGETNSSAALIKDGTIVAGAPEERLSRQYRTQAFPEKAVEYCLKAAHLEFRDIDAVAQAWNPGASWWRYNPLFSGRRTRREDNFYAIPDHLLKFSDRQADDWVKMSFPADSVLPDIYHVQHHRCHAANAYYLSNFEDAAILTADWRGEYEATTLSMGRGGRIELLDAQHIPHSLGMFYATFTEFLGYRPDNDEWKVMALGVSDIDADDVLEKIRRTFNLLPDGRLELDGSYYKGAILDQPRLYTEKLVELLGGREGKRTDQLEDWHYKIAKAMQVAAEQIATHFLLDLHRRTGASAVALSGGFFMNSVFNGKILSRTPFERAYISYAPADLGNSLGAGLYAAHMIFEEARDFGPKSSFIGPDYDDTQIEETLKRRKMAFTRSTDMPRDVARLLADGEVVAVFDGRMEFGERALGHRSILADPRRAEMKDRINSMIKYRESFRPFAPATLDATVHEYFDVDPGFTSEHMERVVSIRPQWRSVIPAVTHIDGSGRVQTVDCATNPYFARIIREFQQLTGVAVVLNTSFNVNGEPIVCSPDDALNTFFNSGLELLALGSFLVSKKATAAAPAA